MTAAPARPDSCAVGVDFGTLSGRAVVVRVSDGAELGAAVHDYRHGVMDSELAVTGEPLPPDWALQDPADYIDVLREAGPAGPADRRNGPPPVVGIGTELHDSPPRPVTRRSLAATRVP